MYKFLLRPKWIAIHLLLLALVAPMVGFANWQWNRHIERKAFNETLIERFEESAKPLLEVLDLHPNREDAQWRLVTVSGTYLPEFSVNVVNVSQNGQAGYDPVSPLQLQDGRVVMINRGFVPLALEQPALPQGEIEVNGRVRVSAERRMGAVSDPAEGLLLEVQRIDLRRLAQQTPFEMLDVYVDALDSVPKDSDALSTIALPVFGNGPHLGYVGQWLLFGLCAIGAWVALVLKEKRSSQQPARKQ
jgi:cytochrome oxidase assembly protein ShyY1